MIDEETRLVINIGKNLYDLSGWKRYRCYVGFGKIYPDLFRYTEILGFEVLVGLKLRPSYYEKYKQSPKECVWLVYTECLYGDFEFVENWYKEIYGTLEVPYNQIGDATKRIDNILQKFIKLNIFS